MQDLNDITLLQNYAKDGSEEAFATLVARHIDKVHSVALRHTRNPHHAEEITQAVFVILARKSGQLNKNVVLAGWLYETARLTALAFVRSEIRRAHREAEAYMQSLTEETESDVWPQVSPLLDTAMSGLNAKDRHAIVLRFFDGKSMREVGDALGANETAAKKRVGRAMEKLRSFFTKRGIALPVAVLTAAISANSVQAAPAALATSITAVAISKGAAATGSTLTLVNGSLKLMAWIKAKTAIAAGAAILLVTGATVVVVEKLVVPPISSPAQPLSAIDAYLSSDAYLDKAPSVLMVRTTHFPEKNGYATTMSESRGGVVNTVRAGGRNAPLHWMLNGAYGFGTTRMILPNALPPANFDYLATLPDCPPKAFQAEIEKVTGIAGHLELREMEVLLLKVKTVDAPGLRPGTIHGGRTYGKYLYHSTNEPMAHFQTYLEGDILKIPVIDQTGLTNTYDFSLDFEADDRDSLKEALLDQLGLELVPARQRIEMLVVELATNSDKTALYKEYKEVSPSSISESLWKTPRLESLPPVLILRPTRFEEGSEASITGDFERWRMVLKNSSFEYILAAAADFQVKGNYCTWPSRIIAPPNLPKERFDLMLTVANPRERLQKEISKQFGLALRREIREVEALVIKDSETIAPRLNTAKQPIFSRSQSTMENLPLWVIAQNLEGQLGKPVLVRTKLTNNFTLTIRTIIKDGYTTLDEAELKRDFLNQLGLELVSGKEPIKMLVVEQIKK
ncbi:MAG: polymerase, sigma-24 subunit, subfamily [Verrucomicrobiales bacterium]|nr:polymerase, sigma-24 subunit, subfamily [Verrucomicrobiales bacterium]